MKTNTDLPTRLRAGSQGLGFPSQPEIEQRAAELALSDGRDSVTDADLSKAAEELVGGNSDAAPAAPEAYASLEQLTAWDEPLEQAGSRVSPPPLENDADLAEKLVEDGIAEADHDSRVMAEDEARESEEEV